MLLSFSTQQSSQHVQVPSAQVLYWKHWFCKVGGRHCHCYCYNQQLPKPTHCIQLCVMSEKACKSKVQLPSASSWLTMRLWIPSGTLHQAAANVTVFREKERWTVFQNICVTLISQHLKIPTQEPSTLFSLHQVRNTKIIVSKTEPLSVFSVSESHPCPLAS